ncbi:hypothetical protein IFM89_036932 [Coptis chinensis]|uniref:Uncharacterized protein n=1 Tax=Coptis chinensis TaxID=261450 RepID=A0A835LU19_9MAGN|nr:hypothetical protein IFM89_036932 [Coptis chinensis]
MNDFLKVSMRDITKSASEGGRTGWDEVGELVKIRNAVQELLLQHRAFFFFLTSLILLHQKEGMIILESPMMVINTVLSVMTYNYPTEKLSVHVSDNCGSDLTFYSLLEASQFAKHWIPFSKTYNIEPRSPSTYFSSKSDPLVDNKVLSSIKKLYEEMEHRIETTSKLGQIPEDIRIKHKGFSEWDSVSSPRDHQTILQVLIDRRNPSAVEIDGVPLPTLVYLAREKRPSHPHNFKAGPMNALIRVSSKISNGTIILNVDCDMSSNNSELVRDALCFFMDEKQGHEIAFVQYPQCFNNMTQNDIYGGALTVIQEVIKPSVVGGFEKAALIAKWAQKQEKMAVPSSAYESSLSLAAYIQFAYYIQQENTDICNVKNKEPGEPVAHGLGTY